LLAEELAGRVVVGDRHIGARHAFVARGNIEHRERKLGGVGAQIADAYLNRLLLSLCGLRLRVPRLDHEGAGDARQERQSHQDPELVKHHALHSRIANALRRAA
jgi:hypothetical protein